ncbi:P-loop ATPase, Sll1717 family [Marivivens marinus]|uniref:P-loop ATPase, Sll1717 family n=1 Tax=Marivivens marinus TaxID=3110173 RepID=UPI003B849F28
MTTLSDHYFGDLEAFDEATLYPDFFKRTFIIPKSLGVSTLRNNRKFIIIGRKGTGKTAIQMHLASIARDEGYMTHHFRFFYDLRSDDYKEISQTQSKISYTGTINDKSLFLNYDFRDVWERAFFRRIAETMRDRGIENAFTDLVAPRASRFSNIFAGLSRSLGIKITASMGPILAECNIDPSEFSDKEGMPLKTFNRIARELFIKTSKGSKIYFFVDELVFSKLDAKEDEITLRAAMVRDVLRTSWEINGFFAVNKVDIHFICSLRPEVKQLISDFDTESGKFLDGKDVELSWMAGDGDEAKLILEVLQSKVRFSLPEKEVEFEDFFAKTIKFGNRTDTIEEFLTKNTWGRPRDVVRLLNAIAKKNPNANKIGEEEIKASIHEYSRSSSKELFDELGVKHGGAVLDALRKGIRKQVYRDSNQLWEDISPYLVSTNIKGLIEELFYLGVIGGYDPDKKRHYWVYRGNTYLHPSRKIRIHPALWSEFQVQ